MENSHCQDTSGRNINRQISDQKTFYNKNFFDADPDWRDKACNFGEIRVWIARKIETKTFPLEVSEYQDTDARKKNNEFWVEDSSKSAVFFDWDFDGGNRTGGGSELKVWIPSEIKKTSNFWNAWTVTNWMHGSKQKVS